jgi:hypothetical protein
VDGGFHADLGRRCAGCDGRCPRVEEPGLGEYRSRRRGVPSVETEFTGNSNLLYLVLKYRVNTNRSGPRGVVHYKVVNRICDKKMQKKQASGTSAPAYPLTLHRKSTELPTGLRLR